MLRIRSEQVEHLDPRAKRSLRDRLIGHVREQMGADALPRDPLAAQTDMDAILSDALGIGLSWETHIAAYAQLRLAGGAQALDRLGYKHNPQAPKAEIAEAFESFLETLPRPIWAELG